MPFSRAASIAEASAGTVAAAPAMQSGEAGSINPFSISMIMNAERVVLAFLLFDDMIFHLLIFCADEFNCNIYVYFFVTAVTTKMLKS